MLLNLNNKNAMRVEKNNHLFISFCLFSRRLLVPPNPNHQYEGSRYTREYKEMLSVLWSLSSLMWIDRHYWFFFIYLRRVIYINKRYFKKKNKINGIFCFRYYAIHFHTASRLWKFSIEFILKMPRRYGSVLEAYYRSSIFNLSLHHSRRDALFMYTPFVVITPKEKCIIIIQCQ